MYPDHDTFEQKILYPTQDTLQHVIKAWWNWQCFSHLLYTYRRWEKHCQFPFSWMNTTTQTWSLKLKRNDFQRYPRRETAASGGAKNADNIRTVLSKSLIQWFWELNFCFCKYRVDCFDLLRLFFCCCWSESLEI